MVATLPSGPGSVRMSFNDYGSSSEFSGLGYGVTVPAGTPQKRDPKAEYVAAGPGWMTPNLLYTISNEPDDLTHAFGPRLYEAMLTDPAVSSSYNSVKLSALIGGVKLVPPEAFKPPAWFKAGQNAPPPEGKANPDTPDHATEPANPDRKISPQQARAAEILEFCDRLTARLGEHLMPALLGLSDAMAYGVKLAEINYVVAEEGQDAGRMVWESIRCKPGWAWRFVVSSTNRVKGILTWDVTTGQYVVVDPDKFLWHSWMPTDSDPRGHSVLRAAYSAWNLKIQNWPLYYQYLIRFASPGIDLEMAPGEESYRVPLDANGVEIANASPVAPAVYANQLLKLYRGGGTLAHPNGSKLTVFEPKSQGEAFLQAFDLFDRQICLAIQLQARATMEAKNGSKADGEIAQDEKGIVKTFLRESLGGVLRGAYRRAVAINFGESDAELYTPTPNLGRSEQQDKPAIWGAVAALTSAGAIGDSQKEELAAEVGLPVPDLAADQAKADEQAKKMAAMMPTDTGKTGSGKTPPKPAPKPGGPPK